VKGAGPSVQTRGVSLTPRLLRAAKAVAVPRKGWRRFLQYGGMERETGVSRTGTTYSAVEVQYRLASRR
jgi:hypothetical protein